MNGASASSVNQRDMSRNDAARQGATLAFRNSRDPSPMKNKPSAALAAALASRVDNHELVRQPTGSDTGPEVGSVKDKIGRLTARPLSPPGMRGRPSASSLSPAPEQVAARLAASRSPARNPSAPPPVSPMSAARLGALRSASRMQTSNPEPEKRELRSPTPLRPLPRRRSSLDRMMQDELESEHDVPSYERPPSQQSRITIDCPDIRIASPIPSVGPRHSSVPPKEANPRLPPRLPPSRGSVRSHAAPPTPLRPSTPGAISTSGLSYNSSTSSLRNESSGMSEEALSNAIVASSLASSRASPAIKVPPPLPPQRRRARSILHLAHSPRSDLSRTPSPPKGMPQTLRGMPKNSEGDHRKHRNPLNKHPHKHHEGDRKRWRREVTEKERKRYEGVWASNKGLLIPSIKDQVPGPCGDGSWPPNSSDMVVNLVVREIWSRSRLPNRLLEQVWDLVDHQHMGLLVREEFVVGMWLIDQQLKGHKLPVKVPDSIWDSVRHVAGIKLPLGKGKAHA
ncbi:uncharacterized protein N7511_009148 [Penicillium nucicola]|uniref:uncharacterized protein n=1 Tax=Penicillium nucicola TaxID=1850975 RepID=UPI0025457D88|nr:uncharacterized protein N7511_009148 [Penicillium nucicola]KAJ5747452.1 hypothetical protein N7511_009148 [Penicillium nucicola]